MFLRKYKEKKIFVDGILTGVFVTQLSNNAGISDEMCGLRQTVVSRAIYCYSPSTQLFTICIGG
jgi:hypothetical protein